MSFSDEDTSIDEMTQRETPYEDSQPLLGEVVKETQDQYDDETNDLHSDEVEGTPEINRRRRKTQKDLFQKNKRKQSRKLSEKSLLSIKGPGEYESINERHREIIHVSNNFDKYCPNIDSNPIIYRNIKNVLDHAMNAYDQNIHFAHLVSDLQKKITTLEEKLNNAVYELEKEKQNREFNEQINQLILEIEEVLKNSISDFIWFVPPNDDDENITGVYSPKVGQDDYNETLSKICFQIIFVKSRTLSNKIMNLIKGAEVEDITEQYQRMQLWKHIWTRSEIGRNVSSELNTKRNTFVHNVKICFERVLLAKKDRQYFNKVIVSTLEWIANPEFDSSPFLFLKNTLFVLLAIVVNKDMSINYRNVQAVMENNQTNDIDEIFFVKPVISKYNGAKMNTFLSINDIALTCIAMKNFIEIRQKENKYDTPSSRDTLVGKNFETWQDVSRTDRDVVAYENNSRTIITASRSSCSSGISDLSRQSSWNSQFRQKNNSEKVYQAEDLEEIKSLLERDDRYTIFNTGKKFTGGSSGNGHGWSLEGVKDYEALRKQLGNATGYKTLHFELKKNSAQHDLTNLFNKEHQDQDNNENDYENDINIASLIATGKYEKL